MAKRNGCMAIPFEDAKRSIRKDGCGLNKDNPAMCRKKQNEKDGACEICPFSEMAKRKIQARHLARFQQRGASCSGAF